MAVPEQTPYKEYTANGSTTSFALGFICDSKNDLIVLVDNVAPPVATWSLVGNNAVFTTAPASGKKIILQRQTKFERTTNFQGTNNSFRPETINKDIDRVWLKLQELGVADMLLKIYVDRLHGEQKGYIDNQDQVIENIIADLRNYVNQQDGSLSSDINNLRTHVDQQDNNRNSYFENLISQQGVSLQQIDSYYNYLMQRLAQIAVDKGWDASFIADASGQNQQSLNNGLESIAQLRATNPPSKGFRVYVKSYHPDLNQGGGYFVSTQKNGLVDNGVTIFASQNPLIFWVRSGVREVTPFMAGAKGDRVQDDQPAFMSALATGLPVKAEDPPVGYRLNAPVIVGDGQVLVGENKRIAVYVDHAGSCFKLIKNGTLKNFVSYPFSLARNYTYDGLEAGESGTSTAFTFNNIDNVKPFYPRNGFVLRGWVFWNTFTNIDIFKYKDNGIWLVDDGVGKNNNYFQFKQLSSNAVVQPDGSYTFSEVNWEQCAIRVNGHQNIFIGGEPAPSKWGVWIDGASSGNRFQSMYGEHQLHPIKTFAGSENFYDSTSAQGTPQIHPDSIVHGPSGKQNTRYTRLGIAPIAAQKSLKGLWFFNEGFGTKILDHSGNKKHLTAVNPNWTDEGRWGKTVKLDAARTSRFENFPIDILDWEKPFTIAMCIQIPEVESTNFAFTLRDTNGRYAAITVGLSIASIIDYNGVEASATTSSYTKMLRSPQDGHTWVVLHFDPVSKKITALDTERGVVDVAGPQTPKFSPWLAGGGAGISTITLGSRTSTGLNGAFSFLGLWQRRLSMSEVSDLVNMKVPNLFPSGAPARIDNQPNSTISLQLTATNAEIINAVNQLVIENNDLKDKMRSAGIMLS